MSSTDDSGATPDEHAHAADISALEQLPESATSGERTADEDITAEQAEARAGALADLRIYDLGEGVEEGGEGGRSGSTTPATTPA